MKNKSSALLKVYRTAGRFGFDWFILGLIGMIVIAYFRPGIGARDSEIPLSKIAGYGISAVFFFYGLGLGPQKLKAGLNNWRLHLVIQLTTFVLFPVLVILSRKIIGSHVNEIIWLGIFFLASLPGTVSSAVVMVSIAKGNLPSAIFNASISTLLGVIITPLWMRFYLEAAPVDMDLGPVLIKLMLQVLLPVAIGILLNKYWGAFSGKYSREIRYFDQFVILLIVYTAFCDSFARKAFSGYSTALLVGLGLAMIVLFYLAYGIVFIISHYLKFNREDKITALFCGSKKSLMHGSLMSKVLFAHSPYIGIVILPVMMYHALQLVMVSIIAQWMSRHNRS